MSREGYSQTGHRMPNHYFLSFFFLELVGHPLSPVWHIFHLTGLVFSSIFLFPIENEDRRLYPVTWTTVGPPCRPGSCVHTFLLQKRKVDSRRLQSGMLWADIFLQIRPGIPDVTNHTFGLTARSLSLFLLKKKKRKGYERESMKV